ncbi:duboraya isoform X2 [Hippoglossus hippoglossus]|uniref:duboraya isoform X2 n=1 Tax=Hippoglossus hippoglossus TaxID=8267 RepID=UPI00148BEFCA|nr:duboraya isoform X2 [Hippoglossus hippoglossus]
MEEEAVSQRSVAELAGRFRGPAPPDDDPVSSTSEKPVRRRPPRSLQLPKAHGDDQEPPGVTSPLSAKTKRNSALIEKLQASLALSPSAQLTSPKSPAFRLLSPAFPPPSPGSAPVTTSSTATPTEEEGPVSFEAPPTVEEGSILSSINKSRARHSLRRRPPSRRHRTSSSGDEVGVADDVAEKATAAGEEVFKTDDKTDASTCPETKQSDKDDQSKTREEDKEEEEERVNGRMGEDKRDRPSSGREDVTEGTGEKEEEKSELHEDPDVRLMTPEGRDGKGLNTGDQHVSLSVT